MIIIIAYDIYSIMISHQNSTHSIPNLASLLYLGKLGNPLESTGLIQSNPWIFGSGSS